MRYKAKVSKEKQQELDAIKHCARRSPIPAPRVEKLKTKYDRKREKENLRKEILR